MKQTMAEYLASFGTREVNREEELARAIEAARMAASYMEPANSVTLSKEDVLRFLNEKWTTAQGAVEHALQYPEEYTVNKLWTLLKGLQDFIDLIYTPEEDDV